MNNHLETIKNISLQIKELEDKLDCEKALVLENFRNMSEEDITLCENKLGGDGIVIQYFPKSTTKTVDSNKLKEDGIYDKYVKIGSKSDFIKVILAKDL